VARYFNYSQLAAESAANAHCVKGRAEAAAAAVWVAAVAAGLSLSLFARLDNIDLAALHCRYIHSYARVLCAPRARVALFATQSAGMCNTREHISRGLKNIVLCVFQQPRH
jgi:hypothetical protein